MCGPSRRCSRWERPTLQPALEITHAPSSHLTIDEFWWTAILAAIILALVSVIFEVTLRVLAAPQSPVNHLA